MKKDHPEYKIYEVTLLINSMLGLLILPKEYFFYKIPRCNQGRMIAEGWPIPQNLDGTKVNDLRNIISRLRNGFVHGHIQLKIDDEGEIESIILEDDDRNNPMKMVPGRFKCPWMS